jgi:phosphopantothenoylcysteine decarboxylase/phosphopantothenate--cysteine ligase
VLLDKHIIVGICGGIASYKAVELVSQLQQAGALVDVIMTEHAEDFVRPLTFSTMSHRPVYSDLWEASREAAERHIALAETAEVIAIVPATANTLAKLAHGSADNMLTAVALATRAPLLLAPAMYSQMYMHPATQANLALLRARGATIVEPEVGRLASGAIGPGRLPETPVLLGALRLLLGRHGDLAGRHVVVTAGGTHEPIDPVRFIGNRSSGKMGYALAEEARDRGARVTLISGPVALPAPYGVTLQRVETAIQMRDAVYAAIVDADVLIMSAAVADFRPTTPAAQKLKKASLGQAGPGQDHPAESTEEGPHQAFPLYLTHNPDILGELDTQQRSERGARRLIRVGFAAETENLAANAQAKLQAKHLDLLIANDVSRSDSGFGTDTNKVSIFSASGGVENLAVLPKTEVATAIWDRVVSLLGR